MCIRDRYSADDELKLAKLRVAASKGRRLYGGYGVGPMLGGEGRVSTAGELADAGLSRMAGAGAFPSPIAHAARLELAPRRLATFEVLDVQLAYRLLLVLRTKAGELYSVLSLRRLLVEYLLEGFESLQEAVGTASVGYRRVRLTKNVWLLPPRLDAPKRVWCELPPGLRVVLRSWGASPAERWCISTGCPSALMQSLFVLNDRAVLRVEGVCLSLIHISEPTRPY